MDTEMPQQRVPEGAPGPPVVKGEAAVEDIADNHGGGIRGKPGQVGTESRFDKQVESARIDQ